ESKPNQGSALVTLSVEKDRVEVRPVAHDAYRVFHDICLLTEGSKPKYLKLASLAPTTGLELIESVLSGHASIIDAHPELAYVLRSILMPYVIRSLSERQTFPVTVRVMRISSVIIRRYLT